VGRPQRLQRPNGLAVENFGLGNRARVRERDAQRHWRRGPSRHPGPGGGEVRSGSCPGRGRSEPVGKSETALTEAAVSYAGNLKGLRETIRFGDLLQLVTGRRKWGPRFTNCSRLTAATSPPWPITAGLIPVVLRTRCRLKSSLRAAPWRDHAPRHHPAVLPWFGGESVPEDVLATSLSADTWRMSPFQIRATIRSLRRHSPLRSTRSRFSGLLSSRTSSRFLLWRVCLPSGTTE